MRSFVDIDGIHSRYCYAVEAGSQQHCYRWSRKVALRLLLDAYDCGRGGDVDGGPGCRVRSVMNRGGLVPYAAKYLAKLYERHLW